MLNHNSNLNVIPKIKIYETQSSNEENDFDKRNMAKKNGVLKIR